MRPGRNALDPARRPIRQQPVDNRSHVTYLIDCGVPEEAAEAYVELQEYLELSIGVTSWSVGS